MCVSLRSTHKAFWTVPRWRATSSRRTKTFRCRWGRTGPGRRLEQTGHCHGHLVGSDVFGDVQAQKHHKLQKRRQAHLAGTNSALCRRGVDLHCAARALLRCGW